MVWFRRAWSPPALGAAQLQAWSFRRDARWGRGSWRSTSCARRRPCRLPPSCSSPGCRSGTCRCRPCLCSRILTWPVQQRPWMCNPNCKYNRENLSESVLVSQQFFFVTRHDKNFCNYAIWQCFLGNKNDLKLLSSAIRRVLLCANKTRGQNKIKIRNSDMYSKTSLNT